MKRVMNTTGYSGTPLAKKLGINEGHSIQVFDPPKNYIKFFIDFPKNVEIISENNTECGMDFIHIFSKKKEELINSFAIAKPNLKKSGVLCISWPKKSSKIETDLDKFQIRKFGLNNGLVDTKVEAIDNYWSGHKFVYRKKDR